MDVKIPIGTDDFSEVREGYYFVDKTKFLVDFFHGHGKVTLITRPRRFGKSLLMSMVHHFLTLEEPEKNRKLFDGLFVADQSDIMKEQGTRPVVFLTLKGWGGLSWEAMHGTAATIFSLLLGQWKHVLASPKISEEDRATYLAICARRATDDQLRLALGLLTRCIEAYYGKKAVLLIDEYDAPIQYAWSNGYYKSAIDFFRVLYSNAFKTNPSLDFAILTGVLRVAKESIFSGLNNLKVSSVISGPYPDACGYTKAEVGKMALAEQLFL